jgi:glucan-binding YG repeat protein
MKKSSVSVFGDYTSSAIKEFERVSGSQITIKLDVSEDSGSSSYVETKDKDSVSVSSSKKSSSSKSSKSTKVTNVTLNAETGRVTWSGSADEYDIIFYKDGENLAKVSTKKEKYDFHNYFSDAGIYSAAVRADNGSNDKGNYVISNVLTLTSVQAAAIKANIYGTETVAEESMTGSTYTTLSPTADANGSWKYDQNGWWYLNSDGSYTVNNWQQIGGKWYYFNQYGYMQTGWIAWQGAYYYLGDYGMLTNSWTPDGYYVGSDGRWLEALGRNTVY